MGVWCLSNFHRTGCVGGFCNLDVKCVDGKLIFDEEGDVVTSYKNGYITVYYYFIEFYLLNITLIMFCL